VGNEKGCSEDQAGLTNGGADNNAQARLLGGMSGGPQLSKSRPDGAHGIDLLQESTGQVRGELKRVARRVSAGRVSHETWGSI
jgi:hypothetical protein